MLRPARGLVSVLLEAILRVDDATSVARIAFHAGARQNHARLLHVFFWAWRRAAIASRISGCGSRCASPNCVGCRRGRAVAFPLALFGALESTPYRQMLHQSHHRNTIRILVFMTTLLSDLRLGHPWVPRSTVWRFAAVTSRPFPSMGAKDACSAHASRDTPSK